MTLNSAHALTLKAFLLALYQLPSLPPDLQTQLNQLGNQPSLDLSQIRNLAKQEPLKTRYQEARSQLQKNDATRSKSDRPVLPGEDENSNEINNDESSDEINNTVVVIENLPENTLSQIIIEILQKLNTAISPQSVIETCLNHLGF